jgi:hypothetical protein
LWRGNTLMGCKKTNSKVTGALRLGPCHSPYGLSIFANRVRPNGTGPAPVERHAPRCGWGLPSLPASVISPVDMAWAARSPLWVEVPAADFVQVVLCVPVFPVRSTFDRVMEVSTPVIKAWSKSAPAR